MDHWTEERWSWRKNVSWEMGIVVGFWHGDDRREREGVFVRVFFVDLSHSSERTIERSRIGVHH